MKIWWSLQNVFGDPALGRTQVRMWFNRFKAGSVETPSTDSKRPGRPRRHLRHQNQVRTLLQQNNRMTISDLSTATGLSRTSVHCLLTKDMKLNKLSTKFVPRLLSQEQKDHRVALCRQNLQEFRDDNSLLEKVITTDESWFSLFEPETKQGSSQWLQKGSVRPQKALRSRLTRKTMLVLFF